MSSKRSYLAALRAGAVNRVVHEFDVYLVGPGVFLRVAGSAAELPSDIHACVARLLEALEQLVEREHVSGPGCAPVGASLDALRPDRGCNADQVRARTSTDSARVGEGTAFAGTSVQRPGRAKGGQL